MYWLNVNLNINIIFRNNIGKTTIINAIFGDEVLPSGHKTKYFQQIEGSPTGDAYLCIDGSNDKKNIEVSGGS